MSWLRMISMHIWTMYVYVCMYLGTYKLTYVSNELLKWKCTCIYQWFVQFVYFTVVCYTYHMGPWYSGEIWLHLKLMKLNGEANTPFSHEVTQIEPIGQFIWPTLGFVMMIIELRCFLKLYLSFNSYLSLIAPPTWHHLKLHWRTTNGFL